MFAEAVAYERVMGRWSRQVAPLLLEFAAVDGTGSLLDVRSRTGALGSAAAALPSVQVTCVDPPRAFVDYARDHGSALTARAWAVRGTRPTG